jgi:DNA polymerase-3 subunit alpha
MDFLGLKNLTMIDYICKDIETHTKKTIVLNDIPLNDKKTYDLISKANTYGVFQLESQGMRNLLVKLKPKNFDDIVAANALFRPGPMENIPSFLRRRDGQEEISYLMNDLKPILHSTYGIMVYQEQVMMISQKIAGFSLGKADLFRKAISKKQIELMKSMKNDFIDGCKKNGYKEQQALDLYNMIEKFSDYGFNKSHSVAYSMIAYQLAYLKANYPLYFFAAILSNEQSSDQSKIHCIQEAKQYGVEILSPSINYSYDRFTVENGKIRYSLLSIKNFGFSAYNEIAKIREEGLFKDIYDFFVRCVDCRLSSKMIESLIDAGAFDEFGYSRATLKKNLKNMMDYASIHASLLLDEKPILDIVEDHVMTKLNNEKEVLGLYLSMHPIELMKKKVDIKYVNLSHIHEYINKNIMIIAQIQRVKTITDKKGNEMCFVDLIDETGSIDGVVFASRYKSVATFIQKGNICIFNGKVDAKDKISIIINNINVIK